jgi:hypothetical protein
MYNDVIFGSFGGRRPCGLNSYFVIKSITVPVSGYSLLVLVPAMTDGASGLDAGMILGSFIISSRAGGYSSYGNISLANFFNYFEFE